MMRQLAEFLVMPDNSLRDVMACIDRNAKGIALVVDEECRLIGTLSDGDIRRAILAGTSLDTPANELLALKASSPYPEPITAPLGSQRSKLLEQMQEAGIRQIPLLDDDGRVADLVTLDELLPQQTLPIQAVIMAGGFGTRLHPLTEKLPKPMLPVGDRPLMEIIIDQLRQAGIRRVIIATHYLSEKIMTHFGDGQGFGVELNYVTEDRPLGTVGALGLMEPPDSPVLVINGDILTRVDFRAMLAFHRKHEADLTVAVRQYDLQVPYGVVESEGPRVRRLREKPMLQFLVSAGIYLLEPSVHRYIPNGESFDMTDLIEHLLDDGRTVVSFPVVEYWLDVGQLNDYQRAQDDIQKGRLSK